MGNHQHSATPPHAHCLPLRAALASNPLLLTLMVVLNRTQKLQRDRAEIYSQCSRLLLHQWKTELAQA